MKKFLALILAVLMIAGSVVSVAAFDDVPANHKHATAIAELQVQKVVAGKTETTFAPDELVTRWQMALFMARATSGKTDDANWTEGAALFTDCTQYLGAIQYCFTKGIIKGVTATEFAPNANITLRDGVIMAVRALGYEKADAEKYSVTGATYWLPYYQTGSDLGLLENLETVAVTKELTRAETAQLIYNMLYTEVYAGEDSAKSYTLNDIAFGGIEIVEVENVTTAYISETPVYFFEENTIGYDEEYVWVTVDENNGFAVSFDTLEKAGFDIENIDSYFGAVVELINCDTDRNGNINDYETYETIKVVDDVVTEVTNDDITINDDDDRIKINKKTHYTVDDEKSNFIVLYTISNDDDCDEITLTEITAGKLEGVLYDAKLYDVDGDGYYEYGFVYYYNIAEYAEANSKGVEKCGVMNGLKDVTYSEGLVEEDVFVYTFDPFSLTVDVKEIIEANEGAITGYSNTTGSVKIDGESYAFFEDDATNCFGDKDLTGFDFDTNTAMVDIAKANIGATYEFYLYDGTLIAFGDQVTAPVTKVVPKYAYVTDFTDFELYDFVLFDAIIDGEEVQIKVNKVKLEGETKYQQIADYSYMKLTTLMNNATNYGYGALYTYTVDDDGYYAIAAAELPYKVSDYFAISEDNSIEFKWWEGQGKTRDLWTRINTSTKIYAINTIEGTVTAITPKETLTIKGIGTDAKFYADYIGFGDPTIEYENRPSHGIATVVYFEQNAEITPDVVGIDYSKYSVVVVDKALGDYEVASAEDLGLAVADAEKKAAYTKFTADGAAYKLATFADVEEIYTKGAASELTAGIYYIDAEGVVKGGYTFSELGTEGKYFLNGESGTILFGVFKVKASDIDLYNHKQIQFTPALQNLVLSEITKVTSISFIDYVDEDGEIIKSAAKANRTLTDYLGSNEVLVAIAPPKTAEFPADCKTLYPDNILRGVIIDTLVAEATNTTN